jgi:tetratricopeptide (TPR) repeat protein
MILFRSSLGTALVLSLGVLGPLHAAPHAQMMDTTDTLLAQKSSAYARAEMGLFREALVSAEAAVQTAQDRFGTTHPSVCPYLLNLASLQRTMARYQEAEGTLRWALALREKAFGPKHASVREVQGHLAALYDDLGRWEEADYFRGKAPDALRSSRISMGLGKPAQAEKAVTDFLKGTDKGSDPARVLDGWSLLAKAQWAQKKAAESEKSLQKALGFAKEAFPGRSMEVGLALEDLGDLYRSMKQDGKAKSSYEEGLSILRLFVGVNFEYSALVPLENLSRAYQATGEHAQAKDLLEKALATCRQTYDPGHPRIGTLLLSLARSEKALGAGPQALRHSKEALGIFQSHFTQRHPLVLQAQTFE